MTIKGEFIRRVLHDESERWLNNQSTAIKAVTVSRSGRLLSGRTMSVTGQGDLSATLTFQHTIRERFLDLRTLQYGSRIVRRNRKIHTRFILGHYDSIAYKLMYGFTDEVVAAIKQQLTTGDHGEAITG